MSHTLLDVFGYQYEHDIFNEINKFKESYRDILVGVGRYSMPVEESFKLFKICVGTKENEGQCISGLERDGIDVDDQFKDLSDSLFALTRLIEQGYNARTEYCFFTYSNAFTNNSKEKFGCNWIADHSSKVAIKNGSRECEVCLYPNSISARYALTWVLIHKLCKQYFLDKNKISNISMELDSNTLQIHIYINNNEWVHTFSFNTVDKPNILALNKWVYCGCKHYTPMLSKVNYTPPVPEGTHVYGAEFMDVYEYDQQLMCVHNKKEKDQHMKKMLKLMLISQMMNSQK